MSVQAYQLSAGKRYIAVCFGGKALFVGYTKDIINSTGRFRQLTQSELPLRQDEAIIDINYTYDASLKLVTVITDHGRVFAKGDITDDGQQFKGLAFPDESLDDDDDYFKQMLDHRPYIEVDLSYLEFASNEKVVAAHNYDDYTLCFFTNQGNIFYCGSSIDANRVYESTLPQNTEGRLIKVAPPIELKAQEHITAVCPDPVSNYFCDNEYITSHSRVIWMNAERTQLIARPLRTQAPQKFMLLGSSKTVRTMPYLAELDGMRSSKLIEKYQNKDCIEIIHGMNVKINSIRNASTQAPLTHVLTNRGCVQIYKESQDTEYGHCLGTYRVLPLALEDEKIVVAVSFIHGRSLYLTNYGRLFCSPHYSQTDSDVALDTKFYLNYQFLCQFAHPMARLNFPKPPACVQPNAQTQKLALVKTDITVANSYTSGEYLVAANDLPNGMTKLTTQCPTDKPYPQPGTTLKTYFCETREFKRRGVAAHTWKPPAVELMDLPDEMLLSIFSHFTPKELAQVAQICRRFYHLALTAGYSHHLKPLRMPQGFIPIRELRTLLANMREMYACLSDDQQQVFQVQVLSCLGPKSHELLYQPDLCRVLFPTSQGHSPAVI